MPKANHTRRSDQRRATRTLDETALLFGCGRSTVKGMAGAGMLDALMAGNKTLIIVASIEKWLGKTIEELEGKTKVTSTGRCSDA